MSQQKSNIWLVVGSVAAATAAAACWYCTSNSRINHTTNDDDDDDDKQQQRVSTKMTKCDASTEQQQPVLEIRLSNNQIENYDGEDADIMPSRPRILQRGAVTIVHGSMMGTCAKLAAQLYQQLAAAIDDSNTNPKQQQPKLSTVELGTIEDYDWWDELLNDDEEQEETKTGTQARAIKPAPPPPPLPATLIVLLPTYTQGAWPPSAVLLREALQELQNDWRIAPHPLKNKLRVAVFGAGSSAWDRHTNGLPAKQSLQAFRALGAKVVARLRVGDDAVGHHCEEAFGEWKDDLLRQLLPRQKQQQRPSGVSSAEKAAKSKTVTDDCGCAGTNGEKNSEGCCQSNSDKNESNDTNGGCCNSNNASMEEEEEENYESEEEEQEGEPEIIDLEDMGDAVLAAQQSGGSEPREMVTPSQAKALKKEGYKLIGTHSAVKLCRWTKHQLRGRGGCYKHTFYGITSYQCMEATPSLACANKCVFCWRHHKNPVGKEWRWKTDDPYYIVDEAVQTHVKMINETRGIPGVQVDRWQEAHTVRHCALSLVGEPIMYPRIGELLGELHRRQISTFLVTNGQHPAAISTLRPITQLYVSVDAPTQESLIAIDRPLFQDAWDRLKQSLASLKDKGQRTVARLTVVKGWNSDEISGYAQLIALGKVSLVEVKGVTFCGKSDASNLNMTNTPWHHEVVDLTRTLKEELAKMRQSDSGIPEYDLACEHRHSCSVLLARVDQFAVDDPVTGIRKWRTWIDYERFQALAARHAEDPSCTFTVEDYTAETPAWALFGAPEEGFDPTDQRHRKKTKHPKYTKFDVNGVPTHDENGQELPAAEQKKLADLMEEKRKQIGEGSTVTELRGGAKEVLDASLMFRGMVVAK